MSAAAWLQAALDLVFPAVCPVCQESLGERRRDPLCGDCWNRIERIEPPCCIRCGVPFGMFEYVAAVDTVPVPDRSGLTSSSDSDGNIRSVPNTSNADRDHMCQRCVEATPTFAWARAAAHYTGPLRDAVHAFKFGRKPALARPLAELILEQYDPTIARGVAALVPVPLTVEREHERGFNQATLLAASLSRGLGVPVRSRWLRRVRATPPQTELGAAARRTNVRGAFAAARAVRGLDVIVVDDVFTTGATVEECCRSLTCAGAQRVGVLTVARVV